MGTENDYKSLIITGSPGFLAAVRVQLTEQRKADKSFLAKHDRLLRLTIGQPRYGVIQKKLFHKSGEKMQ